MHGLPDRAPHRPPAVLTRSRTRRGTSASIATRPSARHVTDDAGMAIDARDFFAVLRAVFVEFEHHAPRVQLELLHDRVDHVLAPGLPERRNAQRLGIQPPQPLHFAGLDQVALVKDVHRRHIGGADFLQHAPDGLDMTIALGAGHVDDVQHQVRLGHLLERRAKRRDERVRQPFDEPDRVRQEQPPLVRQAHLPHQRIERHEQRIRRFRRLLRQQVEQRRLAGVRVADERDERHRGLLPPRARVAPPLANRVDLFGDRVDPLTNTPAVGFEFRFAGSAGADAAAEPGQAPSRSPPAAAACT